MNEDKRAAERSGDKEADKETIDLQQKLYIHIHDCPECTAAMRSAHPNNPQPGYQAPACPNGRRLSFQWLELRARKGDPMAQRILDDLKEKGHDRI